MKLIFCNSYQNYLIQLLKPSLKTIPVQSACRVIIIGGVFTKKFTIFRVDVYGFLIFLHKIYIGSKILSNSYRRHQNFDHRFSNYAGNEASSPDFVHFWRFFCIFRAACSCSSPLRRTRIGRRLSAYSDKLMLIFPEGFFQT